MSSKSDLLWVVERWTGNVSGVAVDAEDRFVMRCWTQDELSDRAGSAGFTSIEVLDPRALGARDDRLVALACR
jgi:hypothetical protein